jgi:hypothetical protein
MKKLLLPLMVTLSLSLAPGHAGLIHRYSFNDGTARDLAGSVDGRLLGPGATIAGGQLQLQNDPAAPRENVSCLEFARSVLPEDGHTVTLAAWFTAKGIGGFARVLNFGDSEGTEGRQFIYFTPCTAEGDARVAITGSEVGAKTYIDFGALDNGAPHLVVIVVDGAAKSLRVFVDGREPRPAQHLGDNTLDKVRPVQNWLGRSSFAADPGLTASIDEFRVYDHALTAEEAAKLHQAGADALPPLAGPAADISGTWDFAVETAMGPGHPLFTFKQEGEKLTGSYRGAFGEAPLTGTLKDGIATFSIKVNAAGREATITYTGTVEGTAMKGKVVLGTFSEGTFTGKKQVK